MRFSRRRKISAALALAGLGIFAAGCDMHLSNEKDRDARAQEDKTRDEVAKATEKAKPVIEDAGRTLRAAAKTAEKQAQAAAEGVKQGWEHGTRSKVNLNSASESDLITLPGITERDARRIISRRPYRDSHELVTKGILDENSYAKIRDEVTAI
jgi:DNA uptake protein ComE-like DNA-binding protein